MAHPMLLRKKQKQGKAFIACSLTMERVSPQRKSPALVTTPKSGTREANHVNNNPLSGRGKCDVNPGLDSDGSLDMRLPLDTVPRLRGGDGSGDESDSMPPPPPSFPGTSALPHGHQASPAANSALQTPRCSNTAPRAEQTVRCPYHHPATGVQCRMTFSTADGITPTDLTGFNRHVRDNLGHYNAPVIPPVAL